MKAAVIHEHGDLDVLRVEEIAEPKRKLESIKRRLDATSERLEEDLKNE